MNSRHLLAIIKRLLLCPAAPYHEQFVGAEVQKICAEHELEWEADRFGNLLVRLQSPIAARTLVLAAHMDHPAFEIISAISRQKWQAAFLGGVPENYFKPGTRLRLMPGASPARLGKKVGKETTYEINAARATSAPQFAVWEMADYHFRAGRIHGRACDDLIGVAVILATLIELKKAKAKVNVLGIISRAEEVGFHGALTVAESRRIPSNALVISLETSREMPPVKMGAGVIVRVGDRSSIFDSKASRFLTVIGDDLKRRNKKFLFQRALMSGGTCEATAYQEYGYQTAAVCVALGNYHNCGPKNRIAAEFVNLKDVETMGELLQAAALSMPDFEKLTAGLPARLRKLTESAHQEFKARDGRTE